MSTSSGKLILTINSGSSSLKMALYGVHDGESLVLSGGAVRLGLPRGRLRITDAQGRALLDREVGAIDHLAAFHELAGCIHQNYPAGSLAAIGHRIVHGGRRFTEPHLVNDEMIQSLEELGAIDPDHTPQAISMIKLAAANFPEVPQVACFDTAFHRHLPRFAQMYALPRQFYDDGILRYGFHGLSYEYICSELARIDGGIFLECGDSSPLSHRTPTQSSGDVGQTSSLPPESSASSHSRHEAESPLPAKSRVVAAHLGNGASMAAILNGTSIDTTMGFSPVSGLVMGTRCGDLDPGAIVHLFEERKMTPEQVNALINKESGLLGVSGSSEDMQDLLKRETTDPHAAEAIQLFCYSAKKYLGAYAAALGGLDTVVFTGGIGENAATIRERICSGLDFLGININAARNNANEPLISADAALVKVRVIKTNEDLMIARHTARLIGAS
jgi:acetate kinase